MIDWKKAGAKADKVLSDRGETAILAVDLKTSFPNPSDAEKVAGLQKKIKESTSHNEKVAAMEAVAATLTSDGLAALKKLVLALLLVVIPDCYVSAQAVVPDVPVVAGATAQEEKPRDILDFQSFFLNARLGYAVNQHMEKSTILYSSFKRYNSIRDVELLNLNFGYDITSKHPLVMMGVRLDNADKLLWNSAWSKKHIVTAPIPKVEFGPFFKAWPSVVNKKVKLDIEAGAALALGF